MNNVIDQFSSRHNGAWSHSPLSNFYEGVPFRAPLFRDVDAMGIPGPDFTWTTNEHYYQAHKFLDPEHVEYVRSAPTPGAAKKRGQERLSSFDPGWEGKKFDVMRFGLAIKFAPGREEAEHLLGTGDALLIEGNSWGDTIWGKVPGSFDSPPAPSYYQIGSNWLGIMLMAQRAELRYWMLRQGSLGFDSAPRRDLF